MIQSNKRFHVALSFPGEHREFVSRVADLLATELDRQRVLYDKFQEAEFARPNLDTHLQALYHDQSELVVVFLCSDYELKNWPRLEWRAIRSLMNTEDALIMFIRFDNANVSGGFSNVDGCVEVLDRKPEDIAALIMERLKIPQQDSMIDEMPVAELYADRYALFKRFFEFARRRDIVFALGGVGSGLTTFLDQFHTFLEKDGIPSFPSADFSSDIFHKIREARIKRHEALIPYTNCNDQTQFDLKCLLATLAYMTYHTLRQSFAGKIDAQVPRIYSEDEVGFAEYYFSTSGAMFKAEPGPIVGHFFSTVQRLAEAIGTDVIVFMPWAKLSECFACRSDKFQSKLASDLWGALGDYAASPGPPDKFDKVCLIVAGAEFLYGHSAFEKMLVRESLWPIPPLDVGEVRELLGMVSQELNDPNLADTLIEWSGGSPWYVRLILSCAQYLSEAGDARRTPLRGRVLIEAACKTAENILVAGPTSVAGPLREFVRRHLESVSKVLGEGETTDRVIEEAWVGPKHEWRRGLPASPRIEAFVASGLTWLKGDIWDSASDEYVFKRYPPTLRLRQAGRLPLVVYQSVTDRLLARF